MKLINCLAFSLVGAAAFAQVPAPQSSFASKAPRAAAKKPVPFVWDSRPVTRTEANQVFAQTRQALSRGLDFYFPTAAKVPLGSEPVTREMVVAEMTQEANIMLPKAKFTPFPLACDSSVLKIEAAQRANLERLIRMGFVGKVGPLATGPADTITPRDLGDAIGFFVCRIAQITHMPDPKWSPMIQDPNG
jgi:hypothetical protein